MNATELADAMKDIATVDDLIGILRKLSDQGCGGYWVRCSDEYWLARKDTKPTITSAWGIVNIGGYDTPNIPLWKPGPK